MTSFKLVDMAGLNTLGLPALDHVLSFHGSLSHILPLWRQSSEAVNMSTLCPSGSCLLEENAAVFVRWRKDNVQDRFMGGNIVAVVLACREALGSVRVV